VEGDVRCEADVERVMIGVRAVAHLAADSINKSIAETAASVAVNVIGSDNVFRVAAAHHARVVYASSASVYGEPESLPMRETDPPRPQTPYCITKLACEQLLGFYGRRHGLPWIALRFFNVFGPGQNTDAYYTSVVLTFVRRILDGEPPVIDGRGEQSMDFVHVDDVARAVVAALDSDVSGAVVNVGTGESTSVARLAEILLAELRSDLTPVFRPRDVLVSRREADITRARTLLGWTPRISVEQGLSEIVRSIPVG
jgi:UDP-glucose 4-epimerase